MDLAKHLQETDPFQPIRLVVGNEFDLIGTKNVGD